MTRTTKRNKSNKLSMARKMKMMMMTEKSIRRKKKKRNMCGSDTYGCHSSCAGRGTAVAAAARGIPPQPHPFTAAGAGHTLEYEPRGRDNTQPKFLRIQNTRRRDDAGTNCKNPGWDRIHTAATTTTTTTKTITNTNTNTNATTHNYGGGLLLRGPIPEVAPTFTTPTIIQRLCIPSRRSFNNTIDNSSCCRNSFITSNDPP